jgi:aspartokinase/homoserine dehydrogenase 1
MHTVTIDVENTFQPEHPGTRIFLPPVKGQMVREKCVCGFSTVDNIALLNVEGSGMIGVPGIAHRLFGALKSANVSVMFIAQASSEHSICFAIKESFSSIAKKAVEEAFFYELKNGLVSGVKVINGCSIIAAVGESMGNMPGVSGIFFAALGSASINVLSISQGCDERNISAVPSYRRCLSK